MKIEIRYKTKNTTKPKRMTTKEIASTPGIYFYDNGEFNDIVLSIGGMVFIKCTDGSFKNIDLKEDLAFINAPFKLVLEEE